MTTPARAAAIEPGAYNPQTGDIIEVRVGDKWLPALVGKQAHHGPAPEEGWSSGIFHFSLVGADYLTGCARVVGDLRVEWRPVQGPPVLQASQACGCEPGECAAAVPEARP